MMNIKTVTVIDPAVKEPAVCCINRLVTMYPHIRFTYHLPGITGTKTFDSNGKTDAILILGSAAFVSDRLEWQKDAFNFVKKALETKIPVLGICFGLQLVVDGFGGVIDFIDLDQNRKAGLRKIVFAKDFEDVKLARNVNLAVNHRQEVKTLPACFEVLASSDLVKIELIKHKTLPFIGIQAHPEASAYFMTEYVGGMSRQEMLMAQEGGNSIIENFFKFANVGADL